MPRRSPAVLAPCCLALWLCAPRVMVPSSLLTAHPQPAQAGQPQGSAAAPTPPDVREASQDQAQPVPIFRTGVGLVLVDVTVTGRDDLPVSDLSAAEFDVIEDGVQQEVEQAQFMRLDGDSRADGDSLEIRSQEHARAEAARDDVRLFAMFMDDYHLGRAPSEMIPLRKGITEFLKTLLGPTDLVTVMNPITPLSALEWTRKRLELADSLHKYEGRLGIYDARSPIEEGHLRVRDVRRVRAEVTLSALTALVAHLGALREGRKSVLFVSHGIPLNFPMPLFPEFEELVRLANRSNVVVHTLDPRGLQGTLADPTLTRLSNETGGRAIVNTNDLRGRLDEVVRDASAYYLLGYSPKRERADGKFHRIQVKVKRPGVRVTARRGYWAPKPDEMTVAPVPELDPAVAAALERLALEETERIVKVWTGFARGDDGTTRLTVAWQAAETGASGATAASTLRVSALNDAGQVLVEADADATGDARRPASVTVDVPPSATRLQFVAVSASGDVVDRWERRVTVPDYSASSLVLAAPQFLRARSPAELQELRRGGNSVPAADHTFSSAELVVVRFSAQGAASNEAAVAAELQSRQGQRLRDIPVNASPDGAATRYSLELPLRSLAIGQYVLRITAKNGAHEASRSTAFAIVR